jgi:hypothetical protein
MHTSLSLLRQAAVLVSGTLLALPLAQAGAIIPGALPNTLATGDDASSGPVALNIGGPGGVHFLGTTATQLFVNTNGNVTFGAALPSFVENGLQLGVGVPIIAPFFADVDTRAGGQVSYGNLTIGGHNAFVVDWSNVGYFLRNADKTNSFQLALIDRSDTGAGNFDIEFNYDRIGWETGDFNGGNDGLGGVSAAVGYSDGQFSFFELAGSLENGAFLDGGRLALASHSQGSSGVLGRYDFHVRGGAVAAAPEPGSCVLAAVGLALVLGGRRIRKRKAAGV